VPPTSVLWVIKGLGAGGAERLLAAAAAAHDRSVVSLECAYVKRSADHFVRDLAVAGVAIHCLSETGDERRWALRLRALITSGRFDVVHLHSPSIGSVARAIVRTMPPGRRPAIVSTEHIPRHTLHPITRFANRVTSPFDDAVIAVSGDTKRSMRGRALTKAEVIVHGIDVDAVGELRLHRALIRSELGMSDDELLIGTVANFRPQKDYPNLFSAARLLAGSGVRFKVVAVGQGPGEGATRALATALGLDQLVTLTGYRADATTVMAACDVFTLASEMEGLPVALMEALALGLATVATDVGGVSEALHHGVDALLVPPKDPQALADAWRLVLEDEALRARLAAAGARRAVEFDVARASRRLEAIYVEVAARRSRPGRERRPPFTSPSSP
jgi:L-malate glycosyltransferase